jgi:uncharacterized protein YrrD/ElaB/YqjD/DUF883 family membrane-anchored ribosome-binding protein
MTAQTEMVRQSDLLNQLVLDRQTLEELGRVETLWMYPPAHRVLGFICKSGFLGSKKFAFKLNQIAAVGASGVLTQAAPQPTEASKVQQLESLIQREVWSDEGNQIGKITDCLFNLQTGVITDYLFISSGWAGAIGETYQLPTAEISSLGKKRVLVKETAAARFNIYSAGLPQKLTQVKESIQQEATQEFRFLTQRAESVTEQAKERLQSLTGQAKELSQSLSQKAKEKAQALSEQLNEQLKDVKAETRTLAEQMAEQVKERSQVISKQVEEGIQTLTIQAEEIFESVTDPSKADVPKSHIPSPPHPPAKKSDSPDAAKIPPAGLDDDDDEPWI